MGGDDRRTGRRNGSSLQFYSAYTVSLQIIGGISLCPLQEVLEAANISRFPAFQRSLGSSGNRLFYFLFCNLCPVGDRSLPFANRGPFREENFKDIDRLETKIADEQAPIKAATSAKMNQYFGAPLTAHARNKDLQVYKPDQSRNDSDCSLNQTGIFHQPRPYE